MIEKKGKGTGREGKERGSSRNIILVGLILGTKEKDKRCDKK